MNSAEEIRDFVEKNFVRLGVNKKREITRLFYEIAKKDNIALRDLASELQDMSFNEIKKRLLVLRFRRTSLSGEKYKPYLPDISIRPENKADISEIELYPETVYYDSMSADSILLEDVRQKYEESEYIEISSYKEYIKENIYSLETYNKRRKTFFIIEEEFDFFRTCPCTQGCVSCGYHIFNMGFGCPYECTYCYLQEYTNTPGIVIQSNMAEYLEKLGAYAGMGRRIGSGEFTDSLALDPVTGYSKHIIEFFRRHPETVFEFKTKSDNIENILDVPAADNVVVAWSLNPQPVIDNNEFYSATLENRLKAASRCVQHGFDVAFHFDPVVYYDGWEEDYRQLIGDLFDNIDKERIRWISLGSLRFRRELKKIIENRFPDNNILDEELIIGFDGKLRYTDAVRADIYRKIAKHIRKHDAGILLYLCMEKLEIWKQCSITPLWRWKGRENRSL
ncbi:MAG: spore photoproduct lyase family protein [Elusimicrobiota bacterium]